MILPAAPEWQKRANCRGTDTDKFYPEKGGRNVTAKRICDRCPVKVECLEYALETDEKYGIWGGTSEEERKEMRRDRREAA